MTTRQLAVLAMRDAGLTYSAIAQLLGIKRETVFGIAKRALAHGA